MMHPFKLAALLISVLALFQRVEASDADLNGNSTVTKCPDPGSYPNPVNSSDPCSNCPFPLDSASGSNFCDFCRKGFYLVGNAASSIDGYRLTMENPREFCLEWCPIGANCTEAGSTLLELPIKQGYWRHSKETEKIYRCKNQRNRMDSNDICTGYQPSGDRQLQSEEIGNMYCDANHKGPLCEVCVSDAEFFNPEKGRCEECPPTGFYILNLSIVFVVGLAAIAIIWLFVR